MSRQTLLERLSNADHLYFAWKNLNKTNRQSFGLSGESIAGFDENLEINLESLSEQLKRGNFKFSPSRPYLIPKANGNFRPLQISEVSDRVILKGIALILEEELRTVLLPGRGVSFAYEKGQGMQDALFKIKEHYDNGSHYVYEADIVDFFGTVNRANIVKRVCEQLPDPSLNELINKGITPRVAGLERIPPDLRVLFADKGGIPQGNPLSPLFSNVYLSPFDSFMMKEGFNLVRYADDFVVLAASVNSAKAAYLSSRSYLKETLNLNIHPLSNESGSKTRIVDPSKDIFSFLSVSFDGKTLFPSVKVKERFITNMLQLCSDTKEPNIVRLLTKVKNKHDGWISTFLFTDVQRYFEEIDWMVNWGLYMYLKGCGWKLSQSSLAKMPTRYRHRGDVHYQSGDCLSMVQRVSSGIPLSKDLFAHRIEKRQKSNKAEKKKATAAIPS